MMIMNLIPSTPNLKNYTSNVLAEYENSLPKTQKDLFTPHSNTTELPQLEIPTFNGELLK